MKQMEEEHMNTTTMEASSHDVVLMTIPAAMHRLSIGRTSLYELMSLGELVAVKVGRSRRITKASIDDFVARRVAEAVGGNVFDQEVKQ
jgi:excisionase family DNA binding protein